MAAFACPFCNAQFDAETVDRSLPRWRCPRCGEPVPAGWQEELAQTVVEAKSAEVPSSKSPALRAKNRRVAWMVLGIMAMMAGVGLAYALWTVPFRRGNDVKPLALNPPLKVASPAEVSLLGYLPSKLQLLAGVKLGEMLQDPVGQKVLGFPRPNHIDQALAQVEKWTGQKIENLDQVVLAVPETDRAVPQLILAIHTRRTLKPGELGRHLKTTLEQPHQAKPVFAFGVDPIGFGRLWYPDAQTVVVLMSLEPLGDDALAEFPYPPRVPREHLTPELVSLLTERVSPNAMAWVVRNGSGLVIPPKLLGKNELELPGLDQVRAWTVSLELNQEPRAVGHLFTGDAKQLASLHKTWEKFVGDRAGWKVEVPPANEIEPAAQWLTWQRRFSVAELRGLLGEAR